MPESEAPVLWMKGIVKRFGKKAANDRTDFDLAAGEVHALLGENGAGKTTLMNILYGLYRPDEGEIQIDGNPVSIRSPHHAMIHGIGMVQQHFTLVPSFSVAENVVLGMKNQPFWNQTKSSRTQFDQLAKKYDLPVPSSAKAWQLSVVEKQRLEILKLLFLSARIIILDEPTAVLTPQESETLFKAIRKMKSEGASIVFISHKLREVMEIADRITVLRQGKVVGTTKKAATRIEQLAQWMVGREVVLKVSDQRVPPKETILHVQGLKATDDRGGNALKGISFDLKQGEILGIAGVGGNGQKELAECLYGLRTPSEGKVLFNGKEITRCSVRKRMHMGIAFIPEDRKSTASCPNLSVSANLMMKRIKHYGIFPNRKRMREKAKILVEQYGISLTSVNQPIKLLSGGNIQKTILARELSSKPSIVIAEHPTRGLDVGAMEFVYNQLIQARNAGTAVLLLAGDLEEIFTVCDRVAVIYEGKIVGYSHPDPSRIEEIGLMMAGAGHDSH